MRKATGTVRRLGLAVVLAVGFGAVYGFACGWGISIWQGLHVRPAGVYEYLTVRADGTPLIQRNVYSEGRAAATYHAMNGAEVPRANKNGPDDWQWLAGAPLAMPRRDTMFLLSGYARVRRFNFNYSQTNWYFIHDGARDGHGYFVGYDVPSKLCAGFIGRNGSSPDLPPVEQWFPVDGVKMANSTAFLQAYGYDISQLAEDFESQKVVMISADQLLEVDLRAGSVRRLMESADLIGGGHLTAAVSTSKVGGRKASHPSLHLEYAVRTPDRVIILDVSGTQRAEYLLPEELRGRSFTWYEIGAGKALVHIGPRSADPSSPHELFCIDVSGKILQRTEFSTRGSVGPYEGAWATAMVVPVPAILVFLTLLVLPLSQVPTGAELNYATALAHGLAESWPSLLVVTLLSVVLAWYCCRRQRRYHQSSGVGWFVFVLLLGLPGLVGYLFHRGWPVLEKCPACGHDVPRDRGACADCGAAFPPPPAKGCEVFA